MVSLIEQLFSKNGIVVRKIAKKIIDIDLGKRINRVEDYAREFEVGHSTVQTALHFLKQANAIQIEARGKLGTVLIYKNISLLKEIIGEQMKVGAMPLPYSLRYEGLATGVLQTINLNSLRLSLAYMRGARRRVEGLISGRYDFVVSSLLAAERSVAEDERLEVALNFDQKTFVSHHRLYFLDESKDQVEEGMKVGVDYSSIDQVLLTRAECECKEVEFIPITYMQIISKLESGEIDVAIWNSDDKNLNTSLIPKAFSSKNAIDLAEKTSIAAIVIRKDDKVMKKILEDMSKDVVMQTQRSVIDKKTSPEY